MRAFLLVAILAVAVPDRQDRSPKDTAKPRTFPEQILGEWNVEKISIGGGIGAPMKDEVRNVRFTPTEILVVVNGEVRPNDSAAYTLDLSKQPIAIDLMPKNGPEKKLQGILKLEGDVLTICFSMEGTRPADFTMSEKSLQAMMHLKRVKR